MKRRDDGSVMILMIFFGLIVAGLVVVITDVSTVFLGTRALQAAADGAVAAAAQKADVKVMYRGTGGSDGPLPLDSGQLRNAIADYFAGAHQPPQCTANTFAVSDVELNDQTVSATLTCEVSLPFASFVDPADPRRISVSASAQLLTHQQ